MEDIRYIIADNVKLFRKKENLTQMELAERADLPLDSIKRVESGKTTLSLENISITNVKGDGEGNGQAVRENGRVAEISHK